MRQIGSSNLEHAVDLGRGHAADGHSGPNEDVGIERVSNCGLVDCDCFSDRLLPSSIEQLDGDGCGAEVLLHANSDQPSDDMMNWSEGEPRLADNHPIRALSLTHPTGQACRGLLELGQVPVETKPKKGFTAFAECCARGQADVSFIDNLERRLA